MQRTKVIDVLTKGLLDGATVSQYDEDSVLFVADWQSFQRRGEEEDDLIKDFFFSGLKASRLIDNPDRLCFTQPYFLVFRRREMDMELGEIHTGLYDTSAKKMKTLMYICGSEDRDWKYFYSFFEKYLTNY